MKSWASSSYWHYKHISAFLYRIDLYIIRISGCLGQFFRGSYFKTKRETEE